MSVILNVFFEDPWWVGLFTLTDGDTPKYCRVVFGKQPLDTELFQFINTKFYGLEFSDSIPILLDDNLSKNPQKRQRQISKQLHDKSRPNASYDAIKEIITQTKKETRYDELRQKRAQQKILLFKLKQQKRKEKHKGH